MSRTLTDHSGQTSRRGTATLLRRTLVAAGLAAPLLLGASPGWAGPTTLPPPGGSVSPAPTTAPASTGQTGVPVGANFHGMWSTYTDAQRILILDRLKAAGADSVRLDVAWAMLQPTGPTTYDAWGTGFVDRVIAMANQRGIKPLVMLWTPPRWANGGAGDRALPTNPADYARVAKWAAARYRGKVVGWEVWNEPNSPAYLTGADPVAYTRLLKAAYPAFKAGDPTVPVVTGGVEYNDTAWLTRMYAAGAKGYFDVLATHPYMGVADANPAVADDGTMWTFTHAAAVHQLMVKYGDGAKKLWFTEFGWSSHANAAGTPNWSRGVTEATQSAYLVKAANVVDTTMPYVTRMFWYCERNTTNGNLQYNNYGLLRLDFSSKPVLTGMRTANTT
jgi:polysaccharide biosynthesis protein PslG